MKVSKEGALDIWEEDESKPVDFSKIVRKVKAYWPLSVLCAVLLAGAAMLYLYKTNPVYNVKASILIQDHDKKGGNSGNMLSSLQDLGLLNGASNVNNEQMVLTSYPLVEQVVKEQQLYLSFTCKEGLRQTPLHPSRLPFKAEVVDFDLSKLSNSKKEDLKYNITWNNSGFTLTSPAKEWKGQWNTPLQMPFGRLVLQQNERTASWAKDKSIHLSVNAIDVVTEQYANNISTEIPNKQTSIINLTLPTTLPQQGMDVLNGLLYSYQNSTVMDNNQLNDSTLTFINQRLSIVGKELDSIEIKIQHFKQANQLADITMQSQALVQNMSQRDQELNKQQVQLSMINSLIDYVKSNRGNPRVIPASLVVDNSSISSAITDYNRLLAQKERLQLSATNENPVVQNLDEQLTGLQRSIFSGLESIRLTLTSGINKVQSQNASLEGVMRNVPAKEREFGDFSRQQLIKRELYLFLLQKREESMLAKSSTLANSRVISPARAENKPISPKRSLILAGAVLIGLILPFGFDTLRNMLNTKVRTREDIEQNSGLPVLGEIGHKTEDQLVIVSNSTRNMVAEQFRVLRANIQFLLTSNTDKVIMVTSSVSGEGKSFISTNLATVFAHTDKKVVLLEMDLRKPKITAGLGLKANKGFSHYVIGKAEIEDIIIPSGVNDNLFVIPTGTIPPNPSELILHPRTEALFAYLRTKFDFIIVDTTPNIVSDAQLISKHADITLYIARLEHTQKDQLKLIHNLKLDEKLPRLNLVVNDIKPKRYGGDYYSYGYGYGYGYYHQDDASSKPGWSFRKKKKRSRQQVS